MNRTLLVLACLGAVLMQSAAQAPANDLCSSAIAVFDGVNPGAPLGVSGSFYTNVGAGTDVQVSCTLPFSVSLNDVWFTYTATGTGVVVMKLCAPAGFQPGTAQYPILTVFSSCGGTEIACSQYASVCTDGSFGVLVTSGTTYVLRVASLSSAISGIVPGTFYLTIVPAVALPTNDPCGSAIPVFNGVNPGAPTGISGQRFTNLGAGTATDAISSCSPSFNDVFFSYTATASGIYKVTTCTPAGFAPGTGAGFQGSPVVSVLASCSGPEINCGMLTTGNCPGGQTAFVATAGTTYYIRVATGGLAASFHLTIVPPAPTPPNDSCASPVPIFQGVNGPYSTAGATLDGSASCYVSPPVTRDVWFSYTATGSGTVTVNDLLPPGAPPFPGLVSLHLAVFAGCGGAELGCIWYSGTIAFAGTAGATYFIRAATENPAALPASFYLTITPPSPPLPNDECTGALPLPTGVNGPFANTNATFSAGGLAGKVDAWYSFTTGACAGAYTIEHCPVTYGYGALMIHPSCGGAPVSSGWPGGDPLWFTCIGARTTFLAPAFTTHFIRVVSSAGESVAYTLTIKSPTTGAEPVIAFSSPSGPGSIQADLGGLPLNGLYFFPVTTNALTPTGPSFYGIAMTIAELLGQFSFGFPFAGTASPCGTVQLGPFAGLPSGITLHAVLLGFATAYALPPTNYTWWQSYTIP